MPKAPRSRRVLTDRKDAEPPRIIDALLEHEVEFVIIGGVAALAHGVQRITRDIDLVIAPGKANCRRAIKAPEMQSPCRAGSGDRDL